MTADTCCVLLPLAFGALCLVSGLVLRHHQALPGGVDAVGTIDTCVRDHYMGEKGWVYTVQFQDAGGRTHRFTPAWNGGQPQEVGKRVAVRYLPADPAGTAQRADGTEPHLPTMLLGLAAACIAASPLALVL